MRYLVGSVAAVAIAAGVSYGARAESAARDGSAFPQLLYFSGADFWHVGAFVHGGLLWSPQGLFNEGFTLKLLAGTGTYRYLSGALGGAEVRAFTALGSVMPGWRFKANKFEVTVYAGLDAQEHRLSPNDPGNSLRGTHFGVRGGADLWYEPAPDLMLAANASVSSIGPTYWARAAAGIRFLETVWIGPEVQGLGGPNYQQLRFGAHATSLKTGSFEWSAGLGFATDSDRRSGLYGRIGVLTRR